MKLTNEQRLAKNAQLDALGSSHSSLSEDIHYIATESWKVAGIMARCGIANGICHSGGHRRIRGIRRGLEKPHCEL